MRAGFLTICFLLVTATIAFADQPYQTIHTSKRDDTAHIEGQANQYFSGQFASQNDIVVMPLPSEEYEGDKE